MLLYDVLYIYISSTSISDTSIIASSLPLRWATVVPVWSPYPSTAARCGCRKSSADPSPCEASLDPPRASAVAESMYMHIRRWDSNDNENDEKKWWGRPNNNNNKKRMGREEENTAAAAGVINELVRRRRPFVFLFWCWLGQHTHTRMHAELWWCLCVTIYELYFIDV